MPCLGHSSIFLAFTVIFVVVFNHVQHSFSSCLVLQLILFTLFLTFYWHSPKQLFSMFHYEPIAFPSRSYSLSSFVIWSLLRSFPYTAVFLFAIQFLYFVTIGHMVILCLLAFALHFFFRMMIFGLWIVLFEKMASWFLFGDLFSQTQVVVVFDLSDLCGSGPRIALLSSLSHRWRFECLVVDIFLRGCFVHWCLSWLLWLLQNHWTNLPYNILCSIAWTHPTISWSCRCPTNWEIEQTHPTSCFGHLHPCLQDLLAGRPTNHAAYQMQNCLSASNACR